MYLSEGFIISIMYALEYHIFKKSEYKWLNIKELLLRENFKNLNKTKSIINIQYYAF